MALKDWLINKPVLPTFPPSSSRSSSSNTANFTNSEDAETQLQRPFTPSSSRSSRSSSSNPSKIFYTDYPTAIKRLTVAAKGLPVSLDELLAFYTTSDLEAFERGEVDQATIRFSVELYAKKKACVIWLDAYR